ncbi:MAG: hypothetical protein HWD59_07375 [Coxiellaceae bacterium]|nr:MAG: hypothetical protein HWD59_07375 [Coxiellaceae bacterium]
MRALKTPLSSAAYLSDEVVYTQLLPVEAFQGSYEKSPEDEQRTFLMAYLIDKAMQQGLASFKYFFLIGADGRVHQYCKIGCKRFTGEENFDGFKLVMHFSAPAPRLVEYKEESRKQTITFHNKPSFWQSEQSTQSIAQLDNTVPMQLQN